MHISFGVGLLKREKRSTVIYIYKYLKTLENIGKMLNLFFRVTKYQK